MEKRWITEGVEACHRDTFGNSGQNLYVSKKKFCSVSFSMIWTAAAAEGDVPPKTGVTVTVRVNGGAWTAPDNLALSNGDRLQHRLELYAYNCLRTPRIHRVVLEFA